MESWARRCVVHRGRVVTAWVLLVVGLVAASGALGGAASDDYALPGSESQAALDLLADAGLEVSGDQAQVVFHAADPLTGGPVRDAVEAATGQLREVLPGATVVGPLDPRGDHQLSADGRTGYTSVVLPDLTADDLHDVADELAAVRDRFAGADLQVEVGGVLLEAEQEGGPPSEVVGILAAVVVLVVAFGSLFAMGLPIVVGVVGAVSGVAAVGLGANVVEMPAFAAPVAAMIAIGVGIDYALLVVTRYREALAAGTAPVDAVALAQATAGRSVLFAGTTVVIASGGLVLMDLAVITGVALGIAASVLVTMLAAVTLLPAMLGLLGDRIDRFGLRRRTTPGGEGTLARRWSRLVRRRPLPWALAATALLVVLSVPALDLRLGFADAGTRPTSDSARRAYDLLADAFGPGTSGPLVVAADTDDPAVLSELVTALGDDPGVAHVTPAAVVGDGTAVVSQVIPTTGPRSASTTELVHRIRDVHVPGTVGDGTSVHVGGTTAAAVDFADYTADRLPVFVGVVLGLAFLLLLVVFRGLLVAVKAVVVNLLSITASLGAVVAVFQWGWGVDLLDLGAAAPVEAWAPMMLIAIVFGLSMDYEVFLLSRVREVHDQGLGPGAAVTEGLARTARVITAAAAIMVCVFGSFVLGSSRELQLFGFGLAAAVLLDATVVRMVLVPAVMGLLGHRAWWLPAALDRRLPHLTVERPPGGEASYPSHDLRDRKEQPA
ncbi:RND superfamily putative drug exporter [Nocardioides sp. J9]|nr:RND superfamily putative drug exporter [Nocardioides sp. J9]